jgi:hypothetical protein
MEDKESCGGGVLTEIEISAELPPVDCAKTLFNTKGETRTSKPNINVETIFFKWS